jgi:hypothetical protein
VSYIWLHEEEGNDDDIQSKDDDAHVTKVEIVKISKALLQPPIKRIENIMVSKFVNMVRQLTKFVTVD